MHRLALGFATLFAFALPALSHAQADLTGTYVGTTVCKFRHADTGLAETVRTKPSELHIVQTDVGDNGTLLNADIGGVEYAGRTIDVKTVAEVKISGVGSLVRCGSSDDAAGGDSGVAKFTFKVNSEKGTGSIVLDEDFSETTTPNGGTLGACTGKWTRTDASEPNDVDGCPL